MAKKKKPAKKQASKPKGPTPKAPPANPQAQPARSPALAAKGADNAKPEAKLKPAAEPAPDVSAASLPKVVAPDGDGASAQTSTAAKQKSVRPSGGKSEAKAAGGKRSQENGSSAGPISEAALPLQTFAVEMQRMAKQSIEQTTEVLERLRDAKSVEEVVSLQTTFMQQSFRRYTEFAGRISQLMTSSHASLFQQSQAAMRSFRSIASGM